MIRHAVALAGLIRTGRGPKEKILQLAPTERIPVIQAKLAADALEAFLDAAEKHGREGTPDQEKGIGNAAASILMLAEGLRARKTEKRPQAIAAVAGQIDRYVTSLGWGFAAGGILFVAAGAGLGAGVGEIIGSDSIAKATLPIGALSGAAAAWLAVPKISRLLLLARCVKTAETWL